MRRRRNTSTISPSYPPCVCRKGPSKGRVPAWREPIASCRILPAAFELKLTRPAGCRRRLQFAAQSGRASGNGISARELLDVLFINEHEQLDQLRGVDRKSTRLNSSHMSI